MTKHPTHSTSALWARFRFSVVGAVERAAGARRTAGRHRRAGRQDLDASGDRT